MKTCTRCKKGKPLIEFHNRKASKDGRSFECKDCNQGRSRQARKARSEHVVRLATERIEQRHEKRRQKNRQLIERNRNR